MSTMSDYAVAKTSMLDSAVKKAMKNDPPDIVERVANFASQAGITNSLTIAQIGWMILGERNQCAKRAKNAFRRGCNAEEIARAVKIKP